MHHKAVSFCKTTDSGLSYNFVMQTPFIVKDLVAKEVLRHFQIYCETLKSSPLLKKDSTEINRYYVHDDPFFKKVHTNFFTPVAIKHFKEDLKPTYNFVSFYEQSIGILPLHADKFECYLTIDLCLNQKEVWPIYINNDDLVPESTYIDFFAMNETQKDFYMKRSKPYLLQPGDALFYSGSKFPHWRPKIQDKNFCDVVLFHFVSTRQGS